MMVGVGFLSFESVNEKRRFLKKYKPRGMLYRLFGTCWTTKEELSIDCGAGPTQMYAENAPEPEDLIWEN